MLKTLSTKSAKPKKDGVEIGGNSRVGRNRSELDESGIDNVEVDSSKIGNNEVGKKGQKMPKSKNLSQSKKTVELDFLIPGAKLTFTKLRQAFVKAPILYHFNPERHI